MIGVCICMHAVIMRGGKTLCPCCMSRGCRMAYLWSLWVVDAFRNLSLQYVNTLICILRCVLGLNGGLAFGGAPITHRVSKYSLAGMCIVVDSMYMG